MEDKSEIGDIYKVRFGFEIEDADIDWLVEKVWISRDY